jgi:hypothetical protein
LRPPDAQDALARRFRLALAEETAGLTPGSWLYSAMPKPDARALAVRFCATLAEDTAGRPMQYRMIAPIMVRARIRDERDQRAAVAYAVEQEWLEVEGGHSAMLTESGRQLVK